MKIEIDAVIVVLLLLLLLLLRLHWLLINVPGSLLISGDFPVVCSSSQLLVSYAGPTPPPNTGEHRYVVSIYEQISSSNPFITLNFPLIKEPHSPNRAKWNLQRFLQSIENDTKNNNNVTFILRAGLYFTVEHGKVTAQHQRELQQPKQDM